MDGGIEHDRDRRRFSTCFDGVVGYLDYELAGEFMTITHTVVPPAIGGRGIAGRLVQAALEHARDQGWKVIPQCSYCEAWMRKHPDHDDVRA